MYYECRVCSHVEEFGVLPRATCGIYAFGLLLPISMGLVAIALSEVMRSIRASMPPHLPAAEGPTIVDQWWFPLVMPTLFFIVLLAASLVVAVVLNFVFEMFEYLFYARPRRCPACGGRHWSWGFTRGFGL